MHADEYGASLKQNRNQERQHDENYGRTNTDQKRKIYRKLLKKYNINPKSIINLVVDYNIYRIVPGLNVKPKRGDIIDSI